MGAAPAFPPATEKPRRLSRQGFSVQLWEAHLLLTVRRGSARRVSQGKDGEGERGGSLPWGWFGQAGTVSRRGLLAEAFLGTRMV